MNRTHLSKRVKSKPFILFAFIIIASSISITACQSEQQANKWNIVYILADDLGWNQVGYHGNHFYETTNIDRIASEGIHFTNAYAADPVCFAKGVGDGFKAHCRY